MFMTHSLLQFVCTTTPSKVSASWRRSCLTDLLKNRQECPICNKPLRRRDIRGDARIDRIATLVAQLQTIGEPRMPSNHACCAHVPAHEPVHMRGILQCEHKAELVSTKLQRAWTLRR